MSIARTLLFFFGSILLFFSIFWITIHYEDLGMALTVLRDRDKQDDWQAVEIITNLEQYKPVAIEEEKDTVLLSGRNFSHFIAHNRYVVVEFYASWLRWGRPLALEYAAAASMLKGEAWLAQVDAAKEKELVRKYMTQGYANLYFFVGGVHMDTYHHEWNRNDITTWVRRNTRHGVYKVTTTWGARDIFYSDCMIILAVLDSLEGADSEELIAASELETDVIFYQTDNSDVMKVFHINPKEKRPALFMLRKDAGKFIRFEGQFTESAISDFVSRNKLPLVTIFSKETGHLIFRNPMKQIWLFATKKDLESIMPVFRYAAKVFNGKLLFVSVEMGSVLGDMERRISHLFSIAGDEPRVVACDLGHRRAKKYIMKGNITFHNIKLFGESYLAGDLLEQEKLWGWFSNFQRTGD